MYRFWRNMLDRRRSHCTISFNSLPYLIYIRALSDAVDCDFIATRELPIVIAYTAEWPNYLRTIINLIPSVHFLFFIFLHNTGLYSTCKIVWKYHGNPFESDVHTPTCICFNDHQSFCVLPSLFIVHIWIPPIQN